MDGYVRVSRVAGRDGDSYISPTVQREAIEGWAGYKGVTIAAWHVDEDWPGGTHERPGLEAAVERAVSDEVDGIVSWKIDRFSRYTEGELRDLRRLEEAGAHLAFVSEDIDTSGPMGRFVYTIMLACTRFLTARAQQQLVRVGKQGCNGDLEDSPLEPYLIRVSMRSDTRAKVYFALDLPVPNCEYRRDSVLARIDSIIKIYGRWKIDDFGFGASAPRPCPKKKLLTAVER